MPINSAIILPNSPVVIPEFGQIKNDKTVSLLSAIRGASSFILSHSPSTVILLLPPDFESRTFNIFTNPQAASATPLADDLSFTDGITFDKSLCLSLAELTKKYSFPLASTDEPLPFSVSVPLYFLKAAYRRTLLPEFVVIRSCARSVPDHYAFGIILKEALNMRPDVNVSLIAVSNLSTRLKPNSPEGYSIKGRAFDSYVIKSLTSCDFSPLFDLNLNDTDKAGVKSLGVLASFAGSFDCMDLSCKNHTYDNNLGIGCFVGEFLPGGFNPTRKFLNRYMTSRSN